MTSEEHKSNMQRQFNYSPKHDTMNKINPYIPSEDQDEKSATEEQSIEV